MINSRFLDGMTIEQAKEEVAKRLEGETRGNAPVGERQVNFRAIRVADPFGYQFGPC